MRVNSVREHDWDRESPGDNPCGAVAIRLSGSDRLVNASISAKASFAMPAAHKYFVKSLALHELRNLTAQSHVAMTLGIGARPSVPLPT